MGRLRGAPAPLLKNSPSPNKILKAFSNAQFGEGDKGGEARLRDVGEQLI